MYFVWFPILLGVLIWRLRRYCGITESTVIFVSISIFLLLSGTYFTADHFTGQGLDLSVIYHLQTGFSGAGWQEHLSAITGAALFILAALLLPLYICTNITQHPPVRSVLARLCFLLLPLALLAHPLIGQLTDIYYPDFLGLSDSAKAKAAKNQALFRQLFRHPENLKGAANKNLVIIYLESFERTYFNEALFPGLTPNLKALEANSLHFTDIENFEASGYTIGGILASQCGAPLISFAPNSMGGMDQFLPGLTCLGDLLAERGYHNVFMGGASLEFAGKGAFFRSHGFAQVQGLEELKPSLDEPDYLSWWGLYDDTLAGLIESKYQQLQANSKNKNQPFALLALTLDTHHPNGHLSRHCTQVYGDGSNAMLNAVHCADALIADLVNRLRRSEGFDNTLLVLASDHIALPNAAEDLLKQGQRRNLLMMIDGEQARSERMDIVGSTFDTGPTLLHLLGWPDVQLGLGRDLLGAGASNNYRRAIRQPSEQIRAWRALFDAFWQFPSVISGLSIDGNKQEVNIEGRNFPLPLLMQFNARGDIQRFIFERDSEVSLVEYLLILQEENMPFGWLDQCVRLRALAPDLPKEGQCAYLGYLDSQAPLTVTIPASIQKILPLRIGTTLSANRDTQVGQWRITRLNNYEQHGTPDITIHNDTLKQLNKPVELHSANWTSGDSYLLASNGKLQLERGLNLLALSVNGEAELIDRLDGCTAVDDNSLKTLQIPPADEQLAAYILLVHDSATCPEVDLSSQLSTLALKQFSGRDVRRSYIAYYLPTSGQWKEYPGNKHSQIKVRLQPPNWENKSQE
ncbi:MAG: sulfatase-like hydrolase/transferase [Parahaliea sp.]